MTTYTQSQLREIDAMVAEHIFCRRYWAEKRGDYELAVTERPNGMEPWTTSRKEYQDPERYRRITAREALAMGFFGDPYLNLSRYTTDANAMMEVEERIANLANYMGEVVVYRDDSGWRGCCLKERYIAELMRIASGIGGFEKTCMSENNWFRYHFRGDELWNLLHATPLQRCLAALAAVGKPYGGGK